MGIEKQQEAVIGDPLSTELYVDYPIGVHPRGFDSWRFPHQFVTGASAGTPPDDFSDGQRWGFQPLHPRNIRDEGFAYLRASLRCQMLHASVLRFDHIMGLHRMYFIPDGFPMDQGTYVEYPAEELYAVLSLESPTTRQCRLARTWGMFHHVSRKP